MTASAAALSSISGRMWPRWVIATLAAVAGHVVVAAVLLPSDVEDPDEEPAGALVLEIATQETAADTTDTTLPLGPQSSEAAASAPAVTAEETPPEVETEKPPPVPTVATEEAEVQKKELDEKKEKVEEPQVQPAPTQVTAAASDASIASAPQAIEAPKAERSAAAAVGNSQQVSRAKLTWHKAILVHLNRHKRFPSEEKSGGGTAVVTFTLDRSGKVLEVRLNRSSGSTALDEEALKLPDRASPLPRPASEVVGETFTLTLPVVFKRQ